MNPNNKVIVIGASTGGINALKEIFSGLPADLPAAILVVLHIGANTSLLPRVFAPHSKLPVLHAKDGAPIETGKIFVAPADYHLMIDGQHMRLVRSAKENHARPAIDPLFKSAALTFRRRVIGVILTGDLDDGTIGLQAVKTYGGTAIVQDPDEADVASMPLSASRYVSVDHCLRLAEIAPALARLAGQSSPEVESMNDNEAIRMENQFTLTGRVDEKEMDAIGTRDTQTCPECGGTLWTIDGSNPPRFRCHTGHAYTAQSMVEEQKAFTEQAVWAAVRALHERHTLMKRLAAGARDHGFQSQAEEYEAGAASAAEHAEALRKMIAS